MAYIERKKSELRKAKGGFIRKQKQEEIRSLNSKFYVDPGSVYDRFNEIIKSDPENNKPRYMKSTGERSENSREFLRTSQKPVATGKIFGSSLVLTPILTPLG